MGCSSCAKAAALRVGNAPTSPIILDDPEPAAMSVRVRVLDGDALGVVDGAVKYVAGNVDGFASEGLIEPMSGDPRPSGLREGRTWYQVGRLGYLSISPAQVRSEQTGEEIVERTVGG